MLNFSMYFICPERRYTIGSLVFARLVAIGTFIIFRWCILAQGSNFVKKSTCPTDKWITKTTCPPQNPLVPPPKKP